MIWNNLPARDQPWKFSGNELMDAGNISAYDFIARTYDPSLGRFLSIDPLAEKYPSISPYAFCAGNPVKLEQMKALLGFNLVDPDGWKINCTLHITQRRMPQKQHPPLHS